MDKVVFWGQIRVNMVKSGNKGQICPNKSYN